MNNPENIDQYIAGFPQEVQLKLQQLRNTIAQAAPMASEKISYAMPSFFLYKNLVHFAANKYHIGFYPSPSPIVKFKKELSEYTTSKGAIQFPLDQELPLDLIIKIVKFRVRENLELKKKSK